MTCVLCLNEAVKNTANNKEFYFCKVCRIEVTEDYKPHTDYATPVYYAEVSKQFIDWDQDDSFKQFIDDMGDGADTKITTPFGQFCGKSPFDDVSELQKRISDTDSAMSKAFKKILDELMEDMYK